MLSTKYRALFNNRVWSSYESESKRIPKKHVVLQLSCLILLKMEPVRLPQKKFYRQRAHSNPMTDHNFDVYVHVYIPGIYNWNVYIVVLTAVHYKLI